MSGQSRVAGAAGIPFTQVLSRRYVEIALAYLAGYVLFDWLSFVHPFASFGITPWNPQAGLSFALILLFGTHFLPLLFAAPVVADVLVRGMPVPLGLEIAAAGIVGGGYAVATALLLTPRLRFDPALGSRQSLLLLSVVAVASAALVAGGYVAVMVAGGLLPVADFSQAALRYWIGDVIGIAVLTPFLLVLMTRRPLLRPSWELLSLLVLAMLALWAVFGFAEAFRFQLFYLFFLPVVWTAVRFGLEGVTVGLVVTQVGLIATLHFTRQDATDVTAYQALMVVLSFTGLAVGVLVSEQQRTQTQLRLNQEALNRALRLSTMGEFAAALAHEINQPLTAVANYARIARGAQDPAVAAEAAGNVVSQVERAAEVIRRLRNFIRLGHSETCAVDVAHLVDVAVSYCRAELDRNGVGLQLEIARELPQVSVDALQIEQVIINIVRNAIEALSEAGRHDGKVTIEAVREEGARVRIGVRDNGPGFDPQLGERAATPFATTKPDGLGLGLSIARSIVEAHGGKLSLESSAAGAVVSFTLPLAVEQREAA